MDQIVFFGVVLLLFWTSIIAAVTVVSILRIRRLQEFELAYIPKQRAMPPALETKTREMPVVKIEPQSFQLYKHVNPSDHVAIAIQPDEGPTRAASHVQRIIQHLQGEKRRNVG